MWMLMWYRRSPSSSDGEDGDDDEDESLPSLCKMRYFHSIYAAAAVQGPICTTIMTTIG